jgi:hypothetical protein
MSDREAAASRRWHGRGGAQRLLAGATGDLGLGCPICRTDYTGTKRASARTSQGR